MAKIEFLPDKLVVASLEGETLLAASLRKGIVHAHACGGHARCTTCRVVVVEGLENCLPRDKAETEIAKKLQLACDIRLACQTKIKGDVKARRLILDEEDMAIVKQLKENPKALSLGEEKKLTILFCDITDFTAFAEKQLSYDVIHILNRYFFEMKKVIERFLGKINNTMGDGFLALFESDSSALDAVSAATTILKEMNHFNEYLESNFKTRFKVRMGVHFGQVVMGSLGTTEDNRKTVIGDAVNLASRIEAMNKEMGTQLLISESVYEQVKDQIEVGKQCQGTIRGKTGEYSLYEIVGLKK